MGRSADRAIRWFVGLSLLAGGLLLLAGAVLFGTLGGPIWVIPLAGVVAAVLAILTAAAEGGPRSPILPASAWIVSVLLGILWARLDSAGHAFLSGYAAIVAFGPAIGIWRRQLWAWPVALASVVGFGRIVLLPTGHECHGSERSDVCPDIEERRARIGLPAADPVARAIPVLDRQVQRDREEEARAGHVHVRRDVHRCVRGRPSVRSREAQEFEF